MLDIQFDGSQSTPFYLSKAEAQYLYEHDIPTYFEHAIDLHPGDIVLDVGANIGLFAISAFQRYGSDINIFAFEPIPRSYEVLCRNKERFGLENLKAFPFGLSDKRAVQTFSFFPRLPARSSAYLDTSDLSMERRRFQGSLADDVESGKLLPFLRWFPRAARSIVLDKIVMWLFKAEQFSCEVRPFSETIRECGIVRVDLLKVDVEGAEFDVLKGIDSSDWPKIRQVVVEVEHFCEQSPAIVELLTKQGFRQVAVDAPDKASRRGDVGIVYASRQTEKH
jgi:FkbM family methyltransferase